MSVHVCAFICRGEKEQGGTLLSYLLFPVDAHVYIQCVRAFRKVTCVWTDTWACKWDCSRPRWLRWHFLCSGCSPDISLVSDQSWFSQMSHSLRYTSLNEGSASAFAETQTCMKNLSSRQSKVITLRHSHFNVSLQCVQICTNVVFVHNAVFMMTHEKIILLLTFSLTKHSNQQDISMTKITGLR